MSGQYKEILRLAKSNHDPDRYEGRSWQELTLIEQESALTALTENNLRQTKLSLENPSEISI